MKIFISAGEASGDALGAHLISALKARRSDLELFGMGGPLMVRAGFEALRSSNEIGVVGMVEVLRHIPRLLALRNDLARRAIAAKPDVAVLIDVPDFNIRLAKRLKRAGIPVVFYVGPSVWAWRPGRAKRYGKLIDRLLVLFPFELPIWKSAGVDVVCVGHPLVDEIPGAIELQQGSARTVALLPGSRVSELRHHLPVLLETAARLKSEGTADRFVLPVAPSLDVEHVQSAVDASSAKDLVQVVDGAAVPRREAIASSCFALVCSGTATLETALIGRPQIIIYRVSWISWWIGRMLARVPFLGLINLIANREIAPELLQANFRPERLAEHAAKLIPDSAERRKALDGIASMRAQLGPIGAADRAADAVLGLLEPNSTSHL